MININKDITNNIGLKPYNLSLKNSFWILIGILIMMPLELTDGLFFSYFLIILLLFTGFRKFDQTTFIFVVSLIAIYFLSSLLASELRLTSLINPVLSALVFLIPKHDDLINRMIKKGIYFSASFTSIVLIWGLNQEGLTSIYTIFTQRDWGLNYLPYYGNGLALLLSIAMIFAIKDKFYKLFILFTVGAILTTSRTPIVVFFITMLFGFISNLSIRTVLNTLMIIVPLIAIVIFYILSLPLAEELLGLQSRLFYSSDRVLVWNEALNSISENLFFGVGAAKLPFYDHAHNSFLQVIFKYGIFAFILWSIMIYKTFISTISFKKNLDFVLVLLLIGTIQIGLHNPNVLLMLLFFCRNFASHPK